LPPGPARSPAGESRVPTLGEVLCLPLNEISRFSLGFLNLVCATLLPDTLDLDVIACLKQLDLWTRHVKRETERNFHRFQKDPGDYQHSQGYYRVAMMVTVLQQDCGVRYDPDCIKTKLFLDSGEAFIHGLLKGKGGTCANMPVLYAAIGRKLGYPIYICAAKAHLFCRSATKDGRERFNIEGSGRGIRTPDDDQQSGGLRQRCQLEKPLAFRQCIGNHDHWRGSFLGWRDFNDPVVVKSLAVFCNTSSSLSRQNSATSKLALRASVRHVNVTTSRAGVRGGGQR
jgi:hypothetical protein